MIAAFQFPVFRRAHRTDTSAALARNYLCTFLNDEGERVDVFEILKGATYFLNAHRERSAAHKQGRIMQIA